jgi:hypothetical protein
MGDSEEEVAELFLRDSDGGVHAGACILIRTMPVRWRSAVYATCAAGGWWKSDGVCKCLPLQPHVW